MPTPTYDAQAGSGCNDCSSRSWSHVAGAGANRVGYLWVCQRVNDGNLRTVSTATWDSASMSQIATVDYSTDIRVTLFEKIGIPSGSKTVAFTLSDSIKSLVGRSVSFTGADQTNPSRGTPNTASGDSDSPSVTVTSNADDVVVDCCVHQDINTTLTVDGTQNERGRTDSPGGAGAGAGDVRGANSTEDGAATVAMDWGLSSAEKWAIIGASIVGASAAGAPAGLVRIIGT